MIFVKSFISSLVIFISVILQASSS